MKARRIRTIPRRRPVALELPHGDVPDDEGQHPHIVRVVDADVEDGVPWITYEFVAGTEPTGSWPPGSSIGGSR